jgi:hypothetical protein
MHKKERGCVCAGWLRFSAIFNCGVSERSGDRPVGKRQEILKGAT